MPLTFYPHSEDVEHGTLDEQLDALMNGAEAYSAVIKDIGGKAIHEEERGMIPRDLSAAYNWEEIARTMHVIRELPEIDKADKLRKATLLNRLAEIYEVLRSAKMPKLEAVRLALMSEAKQLKGDASQVA